MFARGLEGREQEFLDSLHVMEVGMRHFFAKAMHGQSQQRETGDYRREHAASGVASRKKLRRIGMRG